MDPLLLWAFFGSIKHELPRAIAIRRTRMVFGKLESTIWKFVRQKDWKSEKTERISKEDLENWIHRLVGESPPGDPAGRRIGCPAVTQSLGGISAFQKLFVVTRLSLILRCVLSNELQLIFSSLLWCNPNVLTHYEFTKIQCGPF